MLATNLVWNPRAVSNVRNRGALVGTLYGVKVSGRDTGRSVAYQLVTTYGDVWTVWWDGTIGSSNGKVYPYLHQVDTGVRVLLNPDFVSTFDKLQDVR